MTQPLSLVKTYKPFLLRAIALFFSAATFLIPFALAAPRIIVISLNGDKLRIVEL
jgi:hypothetical protein